VAIDGIKFKAMSNRDRNFTSRKIALRINHLEESASRYLDKMVRSDRQETQETRIDRVTHLKAKISRVHEEMDRLSGITQ
jgi:uncharacterized protein YdgA (DUF945 family)